MANRFLDANPITSMHEDAAESSDRGPVDMALLDRIAARLARSVRFDDVQSRPPYAPTAVVAQCDTGYFPGGVSGASLRIRWFETDDCSIHYSERYRIGDSWECLWNRQPIDHDEREHVLPPPDAGIPVEDRDYPDDWRDVLDHGLERLDERIEVFWTD